MNAVVLIHHFLGRLPVCVADVSKLGALSPVNGLLYIVNGLLLFYICTYK